MANATDTARQGVFKYIDTSGNPQQRNLLTLRNISIDPYMLNLLSQVPGPERINNYLVGDSSPGPADDPKAVLYVSSSDKAGEGMAVAKGTLNGSAVEYEVCELR